MQQATPISGFVSYVKNNSNWKASTIRSLVLAMGFDGSESLERLSGYLEDCARHGAGGGFPGFIYYRDTAAFYRRNRADIVRNIGQAAEETGQGVIETVQSFGVFRDSDPPAPEKVGKALWGVFRGSGELQELYNVFAWFALEGIAQVWARHLEESRE